MCWWNKSSLLDAAENVTESIQMETLKFTNVTSSLRKEKIGISSAAAANVV